MKLNKKDKLKKELKELYNLDTLYFDIMIEHLYGNIHQCSERILISDPGLRKCRQVGKMSLETAIMIWRDNKIIHPFKLLPNLTKYFSIESFNVS